MKIPKTIKIGGLIYKVELTEDKNKLDIESSGILDTEKSVIYINKRLVLPQQQQVLVHEAIHALNGELDEVTVEFLAQGIYQIIVDNKFT